MYWQTGSKYAWSLYLISFFILTTINCLETAGVGKKLHIFGAYMGMLHMLPLILKNSPFSYIIAI